MRKFQIGALFIVLALTSNAQKKELLVTGDLQYSLPKTNISVQLEIERIHTKPGIYYQYSERYLASNQAITIENVEFRLRAVQLVPFTVADPARTFRITPQKRSALNYLQLNNKGILCGVNTHPINQIEKIIEHNKPQRACAIQAPAILPLGEEFMMAGSVAKLAEGAAKQIYRIRDSRLSILTGDLEHLPADGASVKIMLDGLDKAEQELTALFMGTTEVEVKNVSIVLPIDSLTNEQLAFRLSAFKGLVDRNDLSGRPYYLKVTKLSGNNANKNEIAQPNTLYTVSPILCEVAITDGVKNSATIKTEIPQLGELMPLSPVLLAEPNIKISIDPTSGRLVSVSK
mgnify:CR=1 FL=1